ncbi:MAG: hypothetical protein QMC83_05445 [Thermodesulfovibrionales bacterium]|nr:hypothetical protein [Thermodesulfovibrionales bacterium]
MVTQNIRKDKNLYKILGPVSYFQEEEETYLFSFLLGRIRELSKEKDVGLTTKEGQRDAVSVLSERIKDLGEIKEDKMRFSELDKTVKEKLLIELFRHAASKANYFGIYDRIFFRSDENIDSYFAFAFELTVREFDDSYGYFINPTHLAMASCIRLSSRLQEGDRLIRLCSKRSECSVFLEEGRCKYSYPSYIGFLSEHIRRDSKDFDSKLENLRELYDICPCFEDKDFGIVYVKRTKDTKTEHAYPSFLALGSLQGKRDICSALKMSLGASYYPLLMSVIFIQELS